jgi:hypothetical protein
MIRDTSTHSSGILDYDIDHIAAPSLVDRSHRGSSTSNTSCGPDFKSEVLERDGDIPLYPNERFGNDPEACRIVPFSKIDLVCITSSLKYPSHTSPLQNLEHITARCASGCLGFTNGEPEALAHLIENGLDHPQNGVSLEVGLHRLLDDRGLVILRVSWNTCQFLRSALRRRLQTPNPYLLPTDIPHLGDAPREQGQSYQTFQWFVYKNITSRDKFPDNFDARFAPGIPKELLPNIHLLDYVYGASALKHWATSNTRNILQILAQKHRSAYSHEEARKHTPKTLKRGRSTTLSPAIGETDYKNKSKARKSKIGMSTQDAFAIMNLLYNPAVLASSRACQEEAERMEKEAKDDRVKSWLATTPSP